MSPLKKIKAFFVKDDAIFLKFVEYNSKTKKVRKNRVRKKFSLFSRTRNSSKKYVKLNAISVKFVKIDPLTIINQEKFVKIDSINDKPLKWHAIYGAQNP